MALIKQEPQTQPQTAAAGPVVAAAVQEDTTELPFEQTETVEAQPTEDVSTSTAVATTATNTQVSAEFRADQDHSDLLDFTSFPIISLKNEGVFQDIDSTNYGKEFNCYILGDRNLWVYRANPVVDRKKEVAYSRDQVMTTAGIKVSDFRAEWEAKGKVVQEHSYLEVLVEMIAPDTPYDGELRILQVSPSSKGRYAGYQLAAKRRTGKSLSEVPTRVFVGPKVTGVANPFYPWYFELAK